MQPQTATDGRRQDGFKPKYRHFHPTERVWVKNPFEHDVVYQVADEYNRPFRYRLPAGKVSELPGGAIATLGVKQLVDEMIQNSAEDNLLLWDERIRSKYEEQIIQQVRSTAPMADASNPGEVNLQANTNDIPDEAPAPRPTEEEAFPGLNQPTVAAPPVAAPSQPAPLPAQAAQGIGDVVAASLPSSDTVISANNAHAGQEG